MSASAPRQPALRAVAGSPRTALWLLLPLGVAVGTAMGSCGSDGETSEGQGGAAGASTTSTTSYTWTVSPTTDTTNADCGVGEGGWIPDRDSCWRPVDWPAPCDIRVAEQPELAVPPLEWESCPWEQPGCTRLKITWPTLPPDANPLGGVSAVRGAGGYRVAFWMRWTDDGQESGRSAVWDADGKPIVVWRGMPPTSGDIAYCDPTQPLAGENRVWIGGGAIHQAGSILAAYVSAPYAELATATEAVGYTGGTQEMHATDDVLALAGMDGNHVTVVDRLAGTAETFGSSDFNSFKNSYPVAQSVLSGCYLGTSERKACIWSRSSPAFEPLVAPTDQYIASIGSDGVVLGWAQCPKLGPGEWNWDSCELWTSPFAEHSSGLAPSALCSAPNLRWPHAPVGDGMFFGATEGGIQVYRLSDGHRWLVAFPPPPADVYIEPVYIDGDELWYRYVYGIVRQRLDALGDGEPCPPP